ncbi:MAG: hypothetical protein WBV84_14465 [Nitrososphaeraceae archaeon]
MSKSIHSNLNYQYAKPVATYPLLSSALLLAKSGSHNIRPGMVEPLFEP